VSVTPGIYIKAFPFLIQITNISKCLKGPEKYEKKYKRKQRRRERNRRSAQAYRKRRRQQTQKVDEVLKTFIYR
jgi:hypothetical protein